MNSMSCLVKLKLVGKSIGCVLLAADGRPIDVEYHESLVVSDHTASFGVNNLCLLP